MSRNFFLHLITERYPPQRGGLETSVARIAASLRESGMRVTVYVRSSGFADGDGDTFALASRRGPWEEPLHRSMRDPGVADRERLRLDFLVVRERVHAAMLQHPERRHVIVSFGLLEEGFIGQQIAAELGIPHVVSLRGSDFSVGFRSTTGFPSASWVASDASAVVCTNREQEHALRTIVGLQHATVIHGAVPAEVTSATWNREPREHVALIADGGFAYKKGTQVLLHAFLALLAEGLPVRLTVAGDVERDAPTYWQTLLSSCRKTAKDAFRVENYVSGDELLARLLASDIYCSPTLGEGCSLARAAALAVGIPIVTTSCGEMPDVASGASHVALVPVADERAYRTALRDAVIAVQERHMIVDERRVATWKAHFSVERERQDWLALLDTVAERKGASSAEAAALLRP
jgi:glycosyltransferase involved in cell wall biosynthesis